MTEELGQAIPTPYDGSAATSDASIFTNVCEAASEGLAPLPSSDEMQARHDAIWQFKQACHAVDQQHEAVARVRAALYNEQEELSNKRKELWKLFDKLPADVRNKILSRQGSIVEWSYTSYHVSYATGKGVEVQKIEKL